MAAGGMGGLEVDHPDHDERSARTTGRSPSGSTWCRRARRTATARATATGSGARRRPSSSSTSCGGEPGPDARSSASRTGHDPRLRDFLDLRDTQMRAAREPAEGFFLAEGEATIRRAFAAGYAPRAVLTTERWLPALDDLDVAAYVVPDDVLEATTGFPVHRGALASFARRPLPAAAAVLGGRRAGRRPRGSGRSHQRRGHRALGRGLRLGRGAADAAVRRPAVPPRRPHVDGRRVRACRGRGSIIATASRSCTTRGSRSPRSRRRPMPLRSTRSSRCHAPGARRRQRRSGAVPGGSTAPICGCGSRCAARSIRSNVAAAARSRLYALGDR